MAGVGLCWLLCRVQWDILRSVSILSHPALPLRFLSSSLHLCLCICLSLLLSLVPLLLHLCTHPSDSSFEIKAHCRHKREKNPVMKKEPCHKQQNAITGLTAQ